MPSANAFSVYNPQEQSPAVRDRYEKFTASLPVTLALRAAGLFLPDMQRYAASPQEQEQMDKAYQALQLDNPLFAARSVALAFDRGLFKRVAINNHGIRIFKQMHTHIKNARNAMTVPGKRGADIKALFDRRWLTVPVRTAGPSRQPNEEERWVLDELLDGATESQIARTLDIGRKDVTRHTRALRSIFDVDTTQGMIIKAYGCGLLEPIELEEDEEQREPA